MTGKRILIAGGYGLVGRRIAAELAPDYQVIVAGRRLEQAEATAAAIGHGVRGRELDVTVEASIAAALDGIALVMSCIDQPRRGLLHAAIERGLLYTDITPHLTELGRGAVYEEISAAARASGARVVLGTGIVPGISNVIVRALANTLGGVDVIETSLLLSASDAAGPASFDYFLKELTMPFEVHVNGADRPAYAFSDPRVIEFPSPFGPRSAYLFPFSDQVLYPRTLGARTVWTRLALEPARLARLLAAAVRIGAVRLVARDGVRHALTRPRPDRAPSEDASFALRVDVMCDGRSAHATLVGREQADAAAAGASGTVRSLIEGEVAEPGVWMPEQVIDPPGFFSHLARHGLTVELQATNATSPGPHDHRHAMPHADHASAKAHAQHGTPRAGGPGETGAHDQHEGHSVAMFRDRFWITLLLSFPTLVWSGMVQQMVGFKAPAFPGSPYVPAFFGAAVYLYGGSVFVKGGVRELRDRLPGMMTLISLAITVAFAFSLAVTLGYPGEALWWELASLVTIMLLGHWIEMRSISQASGALRELARLLPSTAQRIGGETIEEVEIAALREGDLVLVRPGASVPADGIVQSGKSHVNESMITGESVPVAKVEGAKVIAGTVNGSGSLRVRVTGTGERTALANIMRLVEQAQTSRSRAQALADRAAFLLTIVAVVAGALTLVVWLALGATGAFAVERLVSVLVIACPHALGLAVPLVAAISTSLGAQSGLLVRDRRGLEEARNLTTVVFDKTGTLTRGEFRVVDVTTDGSVSANEALRAAAAVERDSEHTIAQGVVKSAEEQQLSVPKAEKFEAIPGHGVRAIVEGKELYMGGPAMLKRLVLTPPAAVRDAVDRAAARGQASVYLLTSKAAIAAFTVADAVRQESREAIQRLHDQGIEVVMLTGDAKAVADAVAADLGIDTVFAEVLPGDKVDKIKELKRRGKRVAMVGDGVNDAPALLTADVAVAIGAGTDVAVEAGDVVLVRSDPRDVPRIIALSRASYRKMMQNLWWAAGYNIVAIPLAAGVLAAQGMLLPPAFAAVLMSASTVIVAINAQLLRRARL